MNDETLTVIAQIMEDEKNNLYPTIYRIDRIVDLVTTNEHFRVPYAERFEEG